MEHFGKTFCLDVKGDYACFTRPEMKVERVSYDVITPSAARAIFSAIFWKPAIKWNVKKIEVLSPIKWISVRRNEVGAVAVVERYGIDFVKSRDSVCFVSLLIMLLLVVILNKSWKGSKYCNIPIKYFIMILSIPIISIFLTNRIFLIATRHIEYNNFAVISSAFLLMINYVIFEVYTWMSRDAELKSLNKLYGQQLELCSRQAAEQERCIT